MYDIERPMVKRLFAVISVLPNVRTIIFESSTDVKDVFERYGKVYRQEPRGGFGFKFELFVSRLYDFDDVASYCKQVEIVNTMDSMNDALVDVILDHILGPRNEPGPEPEPPLEEWELGTDWEPEPEEEKPFDFIAFIDALIKRVDEEMETQENQEPVFKYPDEEPEAEKQRNIFADYVEDLDPVDRMILLFVPLG